MDRTGLIEYAQRDWQATAALDVAYWRRRKEEDRAEEGLRIGDMLRRHARLVRPEWPTEKDRAADLEAHVLFAEMLRRVGDASKAARPSGPDPGALPR